MWGAVNEVRLLFLDAKAEFCNAWSWPRKLVLEGELYQAHVVKYWRFYLAVRILGRSHKIYWSRFFKLFFFLSQGAPLSPPQLRLCSYPKGRGDRQAGTWRWHLTSTKCCSYCVQLSPATTLGFPLPSVLQCY